MCGCRHRSDPDFEPESKRLETYSADRVLARVEERGVDVQLYSTLIYTPTTSPPRISFETPLTQ